MMALLAPQVLSAQSGDAIYGKEMLEVRHCTACHQVEGEGNGKAPDLGRPGSKDISPAGVAASMWNHAPQMWQQMEKENIPVPMLTWLDAANFYAYLYSVRYFDPPGDASRGEKVFTSKTCAGCHALKASTEPGAPAPTAPPVSTWLTVAGPVTWMQQMWNHAAGMGDQIEQKGAGWPEFTLQEMVDLLAYLEKLPELGLANPGMAIGDGAVGRELFETKSCAECHTLGSPEEGKIDLMAVTREQPRLSGLAVAMWNHRPVMAKAAKEKNLELPTFEETEMSNLLAYLFEKGYFPVRGNAEQGRAVYEAKGCASCHENGEAGAEPIHGTGAPFSAARLASAVWRHGPTMKAQINYREKQWPTLTEQEAADLIEYLHTQ
jgi:mono/diheme cytochrome c family protein